jgi:phage terminase small subunit
MPALENPKHERFAQELAKGKSASEAYVNAGYQESRSAASRLSTNVNVGARVAEIQDRGAIRTEITLASLMAEAAAIQAGAVEAKQFSAATAALTAKAKLAGLWVEKSETENVNTNYVVSGDPVDNVADWEAEHSPKH